MGSNSKNGSNRHMPGETDVAEEENAQQKI
jgi:hypothetical protein